jgi:hypothetical protein
MIKTGQGEHTDIGTMSLQRWLDWMEVLLHSNSGSVSWPWPAQCLGPVFRDGRPQAQAHHTNARSAGGLQ